MMKPLWYITRADLWLICSCVILLAMGCGGGAPSPTPTPIYAHYVPPSGSLVRLVFDYPSSWTWKQIDSHLIMVIDPLIPTLPVGYEADVETGSIAIRSEELDPAGYSLDSEAEAIIQFMASWYPNKLVSDQEIEIDDYPARRLTYQAEPNTGFGNQDYLLLEKIILIVDGVFYRIDFNITENNRSGLFGAGYDILIESLQVVP